VLDVGANIGLYTLLAASRVGPSGRVDAFEPGPLALQRLAENVALNALAQVHVHAEAVGEQAGQVRFTLDADDTNRMLAPDAAAESRVVEVPCVRLDEAVGARRYALGKMDVEGAEPLALQGAGRMLREGNPPVWLLELNGLLHAFGWTEERLAGWLDEHGYGLALYDAQARQLRWEPQAWRTRPNVLAVSRQALAQVEERLRTAPRE
jgi:FkbM family methyltransferase